MSKPNSIKKLLLGACKAAGLKPDEVAEAMKEESQVAMSLKSDDGTDVEIDRDEGKPEVGDKARPDGEHHMPDGSVITVENGRITEIKTDEEEAPADDEAEPETDEEKESLKQENQSLKDQNAELQRRLDEANGAKKTEADIEALAFIEECGGIANVKSMKSNYQPPKPEGGKKPVKQSPKSKLDEEYERLFNS